MDAKFFAISAVGAVGAVLISRLVTGNLLKRVADWGTLVSNPPQGIPDDKWRGLGQRILSKSWLAVRNA